MKHTSPQFCLLGVCYLSLKAKVKIWATAVVASYFVGLYIYIHTKLFSVWPTLTDHLLLSAGDWTALLTLYLPQAQHQSTFTLNLGGKKYLRFKYLSFLVMSFLKKYSHLKIGWEIRFLKAIQDEIHVHLVARWWLCFYLMWFWEMCSWNLLCLKTAFTAVQCRYIDTKVCGLSRVTALSGKTCCWVLNIIIYIMSGGELENLTANLKTSLTCSGLTLEMNAPFFVVVFLCLCGS